ncbi:Alpha-mannosyltransferase alg11p [Colletotrichum higginsianum IMI 349063]|uniref:Alpha-mannosyltransferase alg11p n=2 Tax=Colletotrichum higginsianum (strain IMI 349063) TaxID=759273 RepID=A0A1B7YNZ2_COLHI|nr:Alpha-mannosyltransferase alg11p [Colletotrichum higginsianum IMI 349063]OBR13785.1 Alpha-mannosyltransferase alg11p [Colletotrichum higginsianum IMI 349063]
MAPVPLEPEVKYLPLSMIGGHAIAVASLSFTVVRSLYRAYHDQPPSQRTRARLDLRSKLAPLFAGLALVSLSLASYWTLSYAKLSYRVWADQRGVEAPVRFYGDHGFFPGENATRVYPGRWLSDTPVHLDALEIIAEKARRFWWGQQIELATISWSLLLAIEGRRRNIPSVWAYLALAHLVSLSLAQNLFYLALLLTPASAVAQPNPNSTLGRLHRKMFPPKPANWLPHPALFLASFCTTYVLTYWAPSTTGTATFAKIAVIGRVLSFAPMVIPSVAPISWGTMYSDPHGAYGIYIELFRFVSTASFAFHAKETALGLLYNTPDARFHRHSRFLPFDKGQRSTWERTTTAIGKVLGSASDHPVVAAVAWDVLLSGASQGLWAATRALDVNDILASATPFVQKDLSNAQPPPRLLEGYDKSAPESESYSHTGTKTTRRRSPLSKAKAEETTASETPGSGSTHRGRGRRHTEESGEGPEDTYEPSPVESCAAVEGDELPDSDLDWESAALTWGLTALGGLGSSSAGVFGAECTSR